MPGRFTSIGVQLQNLKKPTVEDTGAAIEAVRTGNLAHLQARYERPLGVVGDITRALIVPAPGHRLFIADLSGIESRGLAWLTNEQSKLEAWREFDRTGDPTKEPYYRFGVEDLHLDGSRARGLERRPI
jgi:DNA polymerase